MIAAAVAVGVLADRGPRSPEPPADMSSDESEVLAYARVGQAVDVTLSEALSGRPIQYSRVRLVVTEVRFTDSTEGFHFNRVEGHKVMVVRLTTTLVDTVQQFTSFETEVRAGPYTYYYQEISGVWGNMMLPEETRGGWIAFLVREGVGPVDLVIKRIWPEIEPVAIIRLADAVPTS